jgi:hypothetical protein
MGIILSKLRANLEAKGETPASKPIPVAGNHTPIARKVPKVLYATTYEYIDGGVLKGDVEYTHAENAGEAWNTFMAGHPELIGRSRIVGIAPAIGVHVLDNHGERLSV